MIDHLSIIVGDIERSRAFYDAVMPTLGHERLMDIEEADFVASGYGPAGSHEPGFWIGLGHDAPGGGAPAPEGQHIAFASAGRAPVDAFHAAGLAAGGQDNGPPGIRAQYHENYYACFLIDPDGHHIEAVCHLPA